MRDIESYKYHDLGADPHTQKQHTHNSAFEILHVIKGNGVIVVDDKLYPLEDNCIYFVKPMILHHSAPENCEMYLRNMANISGNYINSFVNITGFEECFNNLCENVCTVLDKSSSQYIDREFKKINSEKKTERSAALMNILLHLSKTKTEKNSINNQITDIINYINQNLAEKNTLEDISKEFNISKYYLCHIFKETTGMSIMNYILSQRISLAKHLMINTDVSISEVAISSGFSCFSYFSRIFKESEGLSPRTFRKKYKTS